MSGHVGDLSPQQQEMLDLMREKLNALLDTDLVDLSKKDNLQDDVTILRFLRARQFKIDESFELYINMLKFRKEFQGISVAGVNLSNCDNELKTGKSYFHNYDKKNRPINYVHPCLHDPATSDVSENQRFTILMMEYGRTQIIHPPGTPERPSDGTATIVFDMTNAALKNIDLQSVKFMVNTFANFYPETLGNILIVDSPWIVYGMWKVIKPWLDPVTAAKVEFIDKAALSKYIDKDRLLVRYGGTDPFKFDYEKYRAEMEEHLTSAKEAQNKD